MCISDIMLNSNSDNVNNTNTIGFSISRPTSEGCTIMKIILKSIYKGILLRDIHAFRKHCGRKIDSWSIA